MADNSQQSGAGASGGASGGPTTNRELLQHLEDQGIKEMFAVQTLPYCDHLQQVGPLPERGLHCEDPCEDCQNVGENWTCLICHKVFCSRYVNEHMVKHGESTGHPVVLSFADLSVWCYPCENYIDTGNPAVHVKSLDNPDAIGQPITLAFACFGDGFYTSCGFRVARWLGTCLCLCNHSIKLRTWFPAVPDGKHTRLPCGRVQNLPDKLFDDFIIDALQGNMPGTYMYTRPRNSPARDSLQNSFHDRAKEGFRYWLIDRPKPTSFGKYGIGSYKTVLGVGNAPRT